MSVKINITDQVVQIEKRETDGSVSQELTYQPPSGLPVSSTKGQILASTGSDWVQLPVGSDDYVLTADSSTSTGLAWAAATGGGTSLNIYSVADYGAVGDGVANDAPAFQSALNAASAGGSIYFPPGTYRLTTSVAITASTSINLRIFGEGSRSVIYVNRPGADNLVTITGFGHVELDHLIIRGNSAIGNDVYSQAFRFESIDQVFVHDTQWYGIQSATTGALLFYQCGVYVERNAFYGLSSSGVNGFAVSVYSSRATRIVGNIFRDYGTFDAYYSKTPNGIYNWVQVFDPATAAGSVQTGIVEIGHLQMDEGPTSAAVMVYSNTGTHHYSHVWIHDLSHLMGIGTTVSISNSDNTLIERISYNTQGTPKTCIFADKLSGPLVIKDVNKIFGGASYAIASINSFSGAYGTSFSLIRTDLIPESTYDIPGFAEDDYGRRFQYMRSTAAIVQYTAVKAAGGTYTNGCTQLAVTDEPEKAIGVTIDAAGGAGVWVRVAPFVQNEGPYFIIKSDGSSTLAAGDPVGLSRSSAGRGKKALSGRVIGRCVNAVAASADALIDVAVSPAYLTPNCLEFPVGTPTHVDHGLVWNPSSNYDVGFGYFAWVRWDSGAYVLADGAGGGHAILLGHDINGNVSGNTWDGTTPISFGGDDPVASGQWHQIAVAWSQAAQKIVCYVNGVPVGNVAWNPTHRQSQAGTLYVGGSDHSNFYGRISALLGIEGIWPFQAHLTGVRQAFRADRSLSSKIQGVDLPGYVSILADYGAPGSFVRSTGLGGTDRAGRIVNSTALDIGGGTQQRYTEPAAYRVYDSSCPTQYPSPPQSVWGQVIPTPPATPANCRAFDSFSRADQDLTTESTGFVGLGSTEAGSLGALPWLNQGGVWGIHNGRAFYMGGDAPAAMTWVENGVANMEVEVTRRPGTWGNGDTGLCLRVVDSSNYIECVYYNPLSVSGGDGKIYLSTVVAGVETTNIGNAVPTSNFTRLRVKAKTVTGVTTWSVYTDDNLLFTGTNETHASATKAGLFCRWQTLDTNANGLGRWDNFTIFATP